MGLEIEPKKTKLTIGEEKEIKGGARKTMSSDPLSRLRVFKKTGPENAAGHTTSRGQILSLGKV